MEIYFDNSATTRCCPEAAAAVVEALTGAYGNPSSMHHKGIEAERLLKNAASVLAGTLKVNEKNIIFTSGGTESDNLALFGAAQARCRAGRHIITSAVEHEAVLAPLRRLEKQGFELTVLPVDGQGMVAPAAPERRQGLRRCPGELQPRAMGGGEQDPAVHLLRGAAFLGQHRPVHRHREGDHRRRALPRGRLHRRGHLRGEGVAGHQCREPEDHRPRPEPSGKIGRFTEIAFRIYIPGSVFSSHGYGLMGRAPGRDGPGLLLYDGGADSSTPKKIRSIRCSCCSGDSSIFTDSSFCIYRDTIGKQSKSVRIPCFHQPAPSRDVAGYFFSSSPSRRSIWRSLMASWSTRAATASFPLALPLTFPLTLPLTVPPLTTAVPEDSPV